MNSEPADPAHFLWEALLNKFSDGHFGQGRQLRFRFKLREQPWRGGVPPDAPKQLVPDWTSYYLFIHPSAFSAAVKMPQAQIVQLLEGAPYWVKGKHRLTFGRGLEPCWKINVDAHPLGYVPVPDARLDALWRAYHALPVQDKQKKDKPNFRDPRKGPLFLIIDSIWASSSRIPVSF